MLGAAHKPGAMPLRPLGLGDMYDAAFRIIRFNPKATVGSAVLVADGRMAGAGGRHRAAELHARPLAGRGRTPPATPTLVGLFGSIGSLGVGVLLVAFGTILVTGMIAHVTAAAAVGRRLTLGEAWAATHGKRWRLIGLALLLGLVGAAAARRLRAAVGGASSSPRATTCCPWCVWGLLSVPVFICLMVWFWVRVYYLPVPALMLEPVGIFGALARGFRLTRKQFWRTFGIALLTLVVVNVASSFLGFPIGIIGQVVGAASAPAVRAAGAGRDPGARAR